jgi:ketosteroid isomerase-like protein
MRATEGGNLETVLSLIAEGAVFLLPGQPPMRGGEAFAGALRSALGQVRIEGKLDIQEFMSLETTPFAGISFL